VKGRGKGWGRGEGKWKRKRGGEKGRRRRGWGKDLRLKENPAFNFLYDVSVAAGSHVGWTQVALF
jgi:hypothetical protein